MDNNQKKRSGFFANSPYDLPMNVPVTSGPAGSIMSPYMNFDPKYLPTKDDGFIFPEGAGRQRGRFEMAFAQIGGSIFAGGAAGGMNGIYTGYREIKGATDMSTAVKRTQMLNFIGKRGAASAQSVGVIALLYSLFGVGLQLARGEDDEYNTITAVTATGLLYKSAGGLRKSLIGGGVGLGIAAAYVLFMKSDTFKSYMTRSR
ncbi:mitochondrial import inner membrane translocase subunit Tim23-like [Mytilus galloprovincialis]|uniref:mitochondrial import inner membrane translocase subunit Tim23-like n=1 Tax=Mytilus galloprovincialis TaxID=29158 RepID=UPI003F7C9372